MTKTMRIWATAVIALAIMAVSASPTPAALSKPVRSGTITGWGYTWPAMFSGAAWDCQSNGWTVGANPECAMWLQSGCNPALAGRNPAVSSSIVDVRKLADGVTRRVFRWDAMPELDYGGVVVQLWRSDCTEITGSKWRSYSYRRYEGGATNDMSTTFALPSAAAWMTVTTNDTANIEWTLS